MPPAYWVAFGATVGTSDGSSLTGGAADPVSESSNTSGGVPRAVALSATPDGLVNLSLRSWT